MRLTDQSGFSLTELVVSMGLSLAVLAAVYGVFRGQSHTVKGQESRMEANEYALNVVDLMVREIRNAGYFPTGVPCTTPANTGGVVSASAQSFRLVYDADGDGVCEEDIAYTYDAANNNILRNGTSITDGNATAFELIYFPQQTSSTAPAPFCSSPGVPSGCSGDLAANIANIKKITISVTVQSKNPDVEFGGQSTVTMSLNADLRNHGLPT